MTDTDNLPQVSTGMLTWLALVGVVCLVAIVVAVQQAAGTSILG